MVQRVLQRSVDCARDDDATAVLTKRINTFLQTNESVLEHLAKNTLHRVSGFLDIRKLPLTFVY